MAGIAAPRKAWTHDSLPHTLNPDGVEKLQAQEAKKEGSEYGH